MKKQGNMEANLQEEFIRFSPMVFSIALRILKSREDAEDVVQEVFTQKLPRIFADEGQLPPENLGPLLARVTRNYSIDQYRRRKHFVGHEPDDNRVDDMPENPFAKVDAMETLMAELEPTYREVLTLKYLLRLGWVEVASKLGLSVQGARKRAEKAKDKLRSSLNEQEEAGA
jgi:RNA polymerase sigma-70 factor, ECF subfamily